MAQQGKRLKAAYTGFDREKTYALDEAVKLAKGGAKAFERPYLGASFDVVTPAIADSLGLSQPLVSHHLRLLRGARLVRGERQARQVFYEVADHHVSGMLRDMASHIGEEAGDLYSLRSTRNGPQQ